MSTLNAPHDLVPVLIRRGLPSDYAERMAAEITDHHRDLVTELRAAGHDDLQAAAEADRRLGEPRTLINKTVREYQRRYWCGRWPLLTFLLGPIPLLFLCWAATMLVVGVCIIWPLHLMGFDMNPPRDGIISTGDYVVNFLTCESAYAAMAMRLWAS